MKKYRRQLSVTYEFLDMIDPKNPKQCAWWLQLIVYTIVALIIARLLGLI